MTAPALARTVFATSRLLEFFSEKELALQIGHARDWWPIALVKELVDNGLDACETAGIAPEMTVRVEPDAFTVEDNGPGLPEGVLVASLDYLVRVSDKNHYIAPTRGQLGNALKTVWAAPFVANGETGVVEVQAGGKCHRIEVGVDRIAQKPVISHATTAASVKKGTLVRVTWPEVACLLDNSEPADSYNPVGAYTLVGHYAACNPHATFHYIADGITKAWAATAPGLRKWTAAEVTSAHWYDAKRLAGLVGAYLSADRDSGVERTVREFVAEFRGLTATAKQKTVLETAGLARARLNDLAQGGEVNLALVRPLLAAMQKNSRPVKPDALGMIGEGGVRAWFGATGHAPQSVTYKALRGQTPEGLPYIIEVAFGQSLDDDAVRGLVVGLNWSPALRCPLTELDQMLGENRVDKFDPVTVWVHLACPRLEYTDRGKGHLMLPSCIGRALGDAVRLVVKHWKRAKRQADRSERLQAQQLAAERERGMPRKVSFKAAAFEAMAAAYADASDKGRLPANARQVWYSARPAVLRATGKSLQKSHSRYFTQVLLPAYQEGHPDETADWDVHYDDRGHLIEPHTGRTVGLGTRSVREYRAAWTNGQIGGVPVPRLAHSLRTCGPSHRFANALFIEKEGFNDLFEHAQIRERFDMAVLSTKGMSVTSARELVEDLSAQGVTIFVLHDFDKSGFEILRSLFRSTRRFQYSRPPRVIDLGVRVADVKAMGLQSEPVEYRSNKDPRQNLQVCGATEDEVNFLVRGGGPGHWYGERVEINAMQSSVLLSWLEGKLAEHGVVKVVPDGAALVAAYRRALCLQEMELALRRVRQKTSIERSVPNDLARRVRRELEADPVRSWDEVIYELASRDQQRREGREP